MVPVQSWNPGSLSNPLGSILVLFYLHREVSKLLAQTPNEEVICHPLSGLCCPDPRRPWQVGSQTRAMKSALQTLRGGCPWLCGVSVRSEPWLCGGGGGGVALCNMSLCELPALQLD